MPFVPGPAHPLPHNPLAQAPLLPVTLALVVGIVIGWHTRAAVPSRAWFIAAAVSVVLCLISAVLNRKMDKDGRSGEGIIRNARTDSSALSTKFYSRLTLWLVWLGIALTGAALTQAAWQRTQVHWPEEQSLWRAQIDNIDKLTHDGITADAALIAAPTSESARRIHIRKFGSDQSDSGDNDQPGVSARRIRINLRGQRCQQLAPGEVIAFWAQIGPGWQAGNPGDFDYRSFLAVHGISGTAYVPDSAWVSLHSSEVSASGGLKQRLMRLRQRLVNQYARHLDGTQLAIIAALTLGDKSLLDADTRALFSDTGTSHILALSGLHLSILFTLLQLALLRWVRRRGFYIAAHAVALVALWLFVILTGAPLSLQRAAWMLTLLQVGACLRSSWGSTLNNLCFAALTLLLVSPLSLMDVGFQMSFAAVLGIVLIGNYVWGRIAWPVWIDPGASNTVPGYELGSTLSGRLKTLRNRGIKKGYSFFRFVVWPFITVSLSAQAATTPFILYYFHSFPVYSLFANVIVIPSAYVLLGGALVFFLVPIPIVQGLIAHVLSGVLSLMTGGLEHISHWPAASLTLYPTTLTIVALVVVPCLIYALFNSRWRRRRVRLLIVTVCLTALAAGSEVWRLRPGRVSPQLIVYNVPRATTVHFVASARESFLYSSLPADSTWTAFTYVDRNYWAPHHIARPALLSAPELTLPQLLRRGNLFIFGHKRLYVLRHNVTSDAGAPASVDVLVIGRGCRSHLDEVLAVLYPREVVLDASLTYYYRQRWIDECRSEGIACHDIRQQGAYVLPL